MMAFLLNKTTIASHFRSHSQLRFFKSLLRKQKTEDLASLPSRQFRVKPEPREKVLLAEDSALKPFKSYKKSVKQLKRIGDVLTILVVARGCYEIYMSELLIEKKLGNSKVRKVQNEVNIGMLVFCFVVFLWQQFGRYD